MRPIVICPTRFELVGLRRTLGPISAGADWTCTGPGRGGMATLAVEDWARRPAVILAGLAGALESGRIGQAWWITDVQELEADPGIGAGGDAEAGSPGAGRPPVAPAIAPAIGPPITPPGDPCPVVTCRRLVLGPERSHLRRRTNAVVVDLESGPFASLARSAGATWGIVRGVSDGPELELPAAASNWVDSEGRTRGLAVAGHLLRRPLDIARIAALGRSSRRALVAVAALLRPVIGAAAP